MPLVVCSTGNACSPSPGHKRPRDAGPSSAATAYEPQRPPADVPDDVPDDADPAAEVSSSSCRSLPLYKRARLADKHKQRTLQDQPAAGKPSPSASASLHLPSPCHICHRRPNKKSTLDSFADCHGCGRKTCVVCIRECPGWPPLAAPGLSSSSLPAGGTADAPSSRAARKEDHGCQIAEAAASQELQRLRQQKDSKDVWGDCGHRAVVCSRCCVEKGRHGDVICLGCLCGMLGA